MSYAIFQARSRSAFWREAPVPAATAMADQDPPSKSNCASDRMQGNLHPRRTAAIEHAPDQRSWRAGLAPAAAISDHDLPSNKVHHAELHDAYRYLQRIHSMNPVRSRFALALFALLAGSHAFAQDPVQVQTRALQDLAELSEGQASAQVLSPNDSVLAAELSATVAVVHADVGSTVSKGQVLIELDATDARLALAQADAQVAAARANLGMAEQRLERAKDLHQRKYASDDDLLARTTEQQGAASELALRQAARRIAARTVEKARLVAPFDGVVVERHAQVGALAAPGTPLLRLIDTAVPEVQAALQVSDAKGIAQAQELAFESQGQQWPVALQRLSSVADSASRTQIARFSFTGEPAPAGIAGVLRWRGPQRLLAPELMVRRSDTLGAFVLEDGRARFVASPDAQEGRSFALSLPGTAVIVVQGQQGLVDGQALATSSD